MMMETDCRYRYEDLLKAYKSGQIEEWAWQQHLVSDEVFKRWVERNS